MVERFAYLKMSEYINHVVSTKEDICQQLISMGIQKGMVVLLQANFKKLGYIVGGEQAILEALMETVGYDGTIVMPTFTPQLLNPACSKINVSREEWGRIRKQAYPFDRKLSLPKKDMLALQFLKNEGVVRSYHPLYSFAAWGKYAKLICDKHPLHFGLSQDSPLGKLVDFNAYTLLLGADYEDCVMFQLARYSGEQLPIKIVSAPIENNKKMLWKDMLELDYNTKNFSDIGEAMEDRFVVKNAYIGDGVCRFFAAKEATTLATAYFHIHKD
ncbi:MAG: AAC(3) family N-acetyltransferase [Longicatena sp.]